MGFSRESPISISLIRSSEHFKFVIISCEFSHSILFFFFLKIHQFYFQLVPSRISQKLSFHLVFIHIVECVSGSVIAWTKQTRFGYRLLSRSLSLLFQPSASPSCCAVDSHWTGKPALPSFLAQGARGSFQCLATVIGSSDHVRQGDTIKVQL